MQSGKSSRYASHILLGTIEERTEFCVMSTSMTASYIHVSQPRTSHSVIQSQAALQTTMTKIEPQPPQPPRKRYSLHQSGYAIDYVEAADAQELLSIDSNFSDGDLFEADLFVSGNSGEATDWTTQKMRNGQEFQDHVKRLQVYSSTVMTPKTAVL